MKSRVSLREGLVDRNSVGPWWFLTMVQTLFRPKWKVLNGESSPAVADRACTTHADGT